MSGPSEEVRREEEERKDATRPMAQLAWSVQQVMSAAAVREGPPPSLRGMIELDKRFIEHEFKSLGPDDDLLPMVDIAGAERDVICLCPWGSEEQMIGTVSDMLPALFTAASARAYVMMNFMWQADAGPDAPQPGDEGFVMPADRPDRIEVVNVCGSDGVVFMQTTAPILRDGEQPPALGEWAEFDEVPVEDAGGNMVYPLVSSLRAQRLTRASRLFLLSRPQEWWTSARREGWSVLREAMLADDPIEEAQSDATSKAFLATHLNEDGVFWPEMIELAERPDLWEIELTDFRERPWEDG